MVQLYIKVIINGKKRSTIIDSGATENFITKKYAENKKYLI